MASQRTKFAVGLFLTCGMVFAILIIIWLGMSRFLEEGRHYVTYFDESVQGLNIDSPVKYRGVFIGRVESIGVAPDSKLIQVVLKIESGQVLDSSIVAQLKSVGITGSMFIELDRKAAEEPDQSPKLNFPTEYPIIASKPSEIGELISGINEVLHQIKSLDLQGIVGQIKLTLENINRQVSHADIKGISDRIEASLVSLNAILDDHKWNSILDSMDRGVRSFNTLINNADRSLDRVNKTLVRVDGIVMDNEQTIKAAIDEFRQAMHNANLFLQKGSNLVSGTDESVSHLLQRMLIVAQNLEKASENLNQIMELLADQPSQLLFGEPPSPRNVEPELEAR
ncbi:MAG: MCE family protein [Desulfobacterales bacterium]|nr:MAG: MCE family protein [Desulfobacterales bacterium]